MHESPTILRRYLSTFIDGVFILFVFIFGSMSIQSESSLANFARIAIFLGMFFLYEPICTSRFCTIGQKLTGIRVRKVATYESISIPAAYLRIVVKILLGLISFLSIPFTKERRAIHDFVSGSIVIMA